LRCAITGVRHSTGGVLEEVRDSTRRVPARHWSGDVPDP
jgi:hypothetical protein